MTILSHPFFVEQVLPFLLVFTVVFAILDKTKILGDGKRQINAIVAFVIGLLFIVFPFPVYIVNNLIIIASVIIIVFLVFMMLYGFAGGKEGEKWMKITFAILIGLALIISLLVLTGYWDIVLGAAFGGEGSEVASNLFFIAIIIAAIIVVLVGKGSGKSD